jgi:hypothetical protein
MHPNNKTSTHTSRRHINDKEINAARTFMVHVKPAQEHPSSPPRRCQLCHWTRATLFDTSEMLASASSFLTSAEQSMIDELAFAPTIATTLATVMPSSIYKTAG